MTSPERPTQPNRTRIVRSRDDRMLGGVCGGLAASLEIDPVLLRIVAVALALSGGFGVLAYLIAWIVIPQAGEDEPHPTVARAGRHSVAITVGACLIALGSLLLLRSWMPWFGASLFWPLVVVAAGGLVLASARR